MTNTRTPWGSFPRRLVFAVADVLRESVSLFVTLLWIMIPVMILVRIAALFGVIEQAGDLFAPLMNVIGLPPAMALVWVTTMIVSPYAGAVVLLGLLPDNPITTAQATVLGVLMLMAHALPIEQRIVQKAGGGLVFMTLLRIVGGYALGFALFHIYAALDVLQGPVSIAFLPETELRADWWHWAQDSVLTLVSIFFIILALLSILRLLDVLGVTAWLIRTLSPLFRFMGISDVAAPMNLSGALLGLTFGGALIIRETQSGNLHQRDVFLSLAFLCLFHGIIEDTLFVMALGADISGALVARLFFTLAVMWVLGKFAGSAPQQMFGGRFKRLRQSDSTTGTTDG